MKVVDGWVCPDLLSGPGNYLRRCRDNDMGLALCRNRRVAIQAGGHIGTVPADLALQFETVFTFEPDPANFLALVQNMHRHVITGQVFTAQGVLGDKRGPVDMLTSPKSTGQHRVRAGVGMTPTYRIDDLLLSRVDAILLDVEGYEIPAVRGAEQTIRRCRPVIIAEENKRALDHGFKIGQLAQVLQGFGYRQRGKVADDLVFTHEKAAL